MQKHLNHLKSWSGLHDLTVNNVQFVNLSSHQELKLTVAHRQRIAELVHNEYLQILSNIHQLAS